MIYEDSRDKGQPSIALAKVIFLALEYFSQLIKHHFIDIAPTPIFAGLE